MSLPKPLTYDAYKVAYRGWNNNAVTWSVPRNRTLVIFFPTQKGTCYTMRMKSARDSERRILCVSNDPDTWREQMPEVAPSCWNSRAEVAIAQQAANIMTATPPYSEEVYRLVFTEDYGYIQIWHPEGKSTSCKLVIKPS